jgi:glycosyltransferase involved in cell wall biosynthesis
MGKRCAGHNSAAAMPDDSDKPVILQVLPALVTGGVERSAIEIAQAVTEADGIALVASAGGPLVRAVERAGGRHIMLPLSRKTPYAIWRNAARLAALIQAENVSLVHARSRAPAWSALIAARRTGVHFVTTYHGAYNEDLPFKRQYNAVMARGEIVIAASHFVAELICARHGTDASRIRVIPRGVDTAAFDPEAVDAERMALLARVWRLPDGAPTIMLPGRLTRWKGQTVLIEALARMRNRDAVAVLVGEKQRRRYEAELVAMATRLGVASRLRLAGHCDEMPAALMLSDVVVNASIAPEAFGRVVIEAQAMARPTIATDHGGAAETVEHGVTGWRVPPKNADALAAALDHALSLPVEERAALGARARAAVVARYTVQAMQAATIEVYRDVLG